MIRTKPRFDSAALSYDPKKGKTFLVKGLPPELFERLEAKRVELGLRSWAETIRVLLEEALK
jgi:hypothetical protein